MPENLPLYTDDYTTIVLSGKPVSKGHMIVSPTDGDKKALSELSDKECDMLFYGASYGATAIFEFLKAQGSNIILTEDDGPLKVNVIARDESDGLDLMWQGKQADPNELQEIATKMKDAIDYEVWAYRNPEEAAKAGKPTEPEKAGTLNADEEESEDSDGEKKINYLLRSLRRMP
ncbi:MAG: hypothetical protein ACLFTH_01025 [Candidatus Woesearchaeota archaeon]